MSTDIGLQSLNHQVGNLTWKLSRTGDSHHPNITLDVSKFSADEQQTVTITGTPTGGTFTLSFNGQTTAGIAYNATAAAVQAALELLSTIGDGNVRVSGGPGPGTPYVVRFINTLGRTDVAAMTASGASLTGGTTPAVAVTTTTLPHFPNGYIPSGTALGKVTASGLYGPYDDTASDGRQVFAGLLLADCRVVRQYGSLASRVGSGMLVRGDVKQSKLPFQSGAGSIDTNGKADNPLIRFE